MTKDIFRTRWRVVPYRGTNSGKFPWRVESRLWWWPIYFDHGGDYTSEGAVELAKRMADTTKIQVI